MFYEFVNKKGKHVAFNVNSVLFVGERMTANGEIKLSVCFQDGSFQELSENYDVFTRELTKRLNVVLLPKNSFTKRHAYSIWGQLSREKSVALYGF